MRPADVALPPNHHSYQTGVWSLHMLSLLTSGLPAHRHALTTVTVVVFGSVSLFAALRFYLAFPSARAEHTEAHPAALLFLEAYHVGVDQAP